MKRTFIVVSTMLAMTNPPFSPFREYLSQLIDHDNPDVTSIEGAYTYVLTGEEKGLSIRAFDSRMRRTAYEKQKGICPGCNEHLEIEQMQADRRTSWSKGGKKVEEYCVMLCQPCNRKKWDV